MVDASIALTDLLPRKSNAPVTGPLDIFTFTKNSLRASWNIVADHFALPLNFQQASTQISLFSDVMLANNSLDPLS